MPTFETADDVRPLLSAAIAKYHQELQTVGVTVALMYAFASKDEDGEPKGNALKVHGWPAAAKIKINSLADRCEGKDDCTITIDGDRWKELAEPRRLALLDHELEHLIVCRDAEGAVRKDDADRPKLRIRPHDMQGGVFVEVMKRHKEHAIDAEVCSEFSRCLEQAEIPWG